jgi:hypothetical protein
MNRLCTRATASVSKIGVITLGRLHPGRDDDDPRGRLFYQRRPDQIVCPQTRTQAGWRCEVIATTDSGVQRGPADDRHVTIPEYDMANLRTVLGARLLDPDGWALVWAARARQRFGNTATATAARVLVEQVRLPYQLRLTLDPAGIRRIALAASVRRGVLGRIVLRLAEANMLRLSTLDTPAKITLTLTGPGMPT